MPAVFILDESHQPKAKYDFSLNQPEIKIGRDGNNHIIILDDDSLSTEHCVIKRVFGGFIIKDLSSVNGLSMNGAKITKAIIQDNIIHVGNTAIRFYLNEQEFMQLAKEPQQPSVYVEEVHLSDIQRLQNGEITELPFRFGEAAPSQSATPQLSTSLVKNAAPGSAAPSLSRATMSTPNSTAMNRPSLSKPVAKKGNPAAAFICALIFLIIGGAIGLCVKHYSKHKTILIEDVMNGKARSDLF